MPSTFITINALVSALIALFGGIGNILIMIAFVKTKSLQTINNVFLFQLAIVDCTKAFFILSVKAYTQLADEHYVAGYYCQFSGFISCMTFIHSALLLAAIAVVRYVKIVKSRAFDKVFSRRRMIYYCSGLLTATTCLAVLPLFGVGEYEYSDSHGVCFTSWADKNVVFRSLFYVYVMGVCFPVLVFCYVCIFFSLRKHSQRILANVRLARQRSAQKAATLKAALMQKNEEGSYRIMESSSNLEDIVEPGMDISSNANGDTKVVKWSISIDHNSDEADLSVGIDKEGESAEADPRVKEIETSDENFDKSDSCKKEKEKEHVERKPSENNPSLKETAANDDGPKSRKISFPILNGKKEKEANSNGRKESASLSSHAIRNEIRITKVMFTVVIAFSLCWLPAFFTTLLQYTNVTTISPTGLYIIITLVDMKVLINPLIYGIWNKQFRHALKSLFIRGLSSMTSSARDGESRTSHSQSYAANQ